jgi:hypothetical protein
MTYEIVKIGIPIQQEYVSQEFIDALNDIKHSKECVAISTVEYSSMEMNLAPAGNKLLADTLPIEKFDSTLKFHTLNTMGFIWSRGGSRDIPTMVKELLELLDAQQETLNFKRIYIFGSGSPNCGDSLTTVIKRIRPDQVRVIDTMSSVSIAIKKINLPCKFEERNYHLDFLIKDNKYVSTDKINLFTCLQKGYEFNIKDKPILETFFEDMDQFFTDDDIFQTVNVGEYDCELNTLSYAEAKTKINELYNHPKALTFAVYKSNLVNLDKE